MIVHRVPVTTGERTRVLRWRDFSDEIREVSSLNIDEGNPDAIKVREDKLNRIRVLAVLNRPAQGYARIEDRLAIQSDFRIRTVIEEFFAKYVVSTVWDEWHMRKKLGIPDSGERPGALTLAQIVDLLNQLLVYRGYVVRVKKREVEMYLLMLGFSRKRGEKEVWYARLNPETREVHLQTKRLGGCVKKRGGDVEMGGS